MRHLSKTDLKMIESTGGKVARQPITPDMTRLLAEKAIASMKDALNHNDFVIAEVIKLISPKPVRFDISRDNRGNMISITPIYDKVK